MRTIPIITLTTDFGVADGYAATMKGVMLDINPRAQLIDITHEIPPQNVRQTAYILHTAYRFFPSRTVHLVVVDPGVGSPRRPIAVRTSRGAFVGPDNGVFSYVMADDVVEAVVQLADSRYRLPEVSRTFHGRDVFAPAAAHLAAGVPIDQLGPEVSDAVTLPLPILEVESDAISGEVLHADRFGNVITSIGRLLWKDDGLLLVPAFREGVAERVRFDSRKALVTVAGQELRGLRRTYADVMPGDLLALVGSEGHAEIAVREGSAAERLGLQPGDRVELRC
ncbi:MAG: SAM-dependent chlorinase/fluorinase [Anaerolineae bacterium]|jgi:S-adenosylmethionine hydrolase